MLQRTIPPQEKLTNSTLRPVSQIETEVVIDIMGYHAKWFVTQQSEIVIIFFNQGQTVGQLQVTVLYFQDLTFGLLTLFFSGQQIWQHLIQWNQYTEDYKKRSEERFPPSHLGAMLCLGCAQSGSSFEVLFCFFFFKLTDWQYAMIYFCFSSQIMLDAW